jgi:putative membrane protein
MRKILLPLAMMVTIAACGDDDEREMASAAALDSPAMEAEPASDAAVTDPQIAHIVVTANEVDIRASELATGEGESPEVIEFAERMITDHHGVNVAATELVTRLGVTPEPNPVSEQLRQGGEEALRELQALSGVAFDRAYIDNEVAYHQAVLDALDQTLIPSARNAELRALLEQSRPAFVAHLDHAKQIQASLGRGQ